MKPLISCLLILAFVAQPALAGNCHVLYRQRQAVVVNHGYQHAYVAPIVAPVVYKVGEELAFRAIVERVLNEREAEKLKAKPKAEPQQSTGSVLAAKCVRCHNASKKSGEIAFDGSERIDAKTKVATISMMGLREGIPDEMSGVMAGLTSDEIPRLTEEVLRFNERFAETSEAGVLE